MDEQTRKVVHWKLGLIGEDNVDAQKWFAVPTHHRREIAHLVGTEISKFVRHAIESKFDDGKLPAADRTRGETLWALLVQWARDGGFKAESEFKSRIDYGLEAYFKKVPVKPTRLASPAAKAATTRNPGPAFSNAPIGEKAAPMTPPADPAAVAPTTETPAPSVDPTGVATPETSDPRPAPSAAWKYLPVPDEPDKHDEEFSIAAGAPERFKLVGARVRGKKHKHEGTNCDDWFEFKVSGDWTIIAVADGAGSKKFSRVGAKASCRAAVEHLTEQLKDIKIRDRELNNDMFARDKETYAFADTDLERLQLALHAAVNKAYEAVVAAADARKDKEEYSALLGGRSADVNDFSATLLLAVHSQCKYQGADLSLAMACQVGDGMIAGIKKSGALQLMAVADSGEFSGETDFLTSKKKLEPAILKSKTIPFVGSLRALMLMTDGVADDYFPNDPGMLRLYSDLVLNGVVELPKPKDEELKTALEGVKSQSVEEVALIDSLRPAERVIAEPSQAGAVVHSAAAFAEAVGVAPEALTGKSALLSLAAASRADETPAHERLEVWLDSYQVRGSFDDRTLVVLYPENSL